MNDLSYLDEYHKNGGEYLIPVEVMNNLRSEIEELITYIEDKIKDCENTLEKLEGTGSFRIAVLQAKIRDY